MVVPIRSVPVISQGSTTIPTTAIKGILLAGTEHAKDEPPPTTGAAGTAGAFLRGPEQFGAPP
jgi:hypothetical protein